MYYKISNILTFLENSINKGITEKIQGEILILSIRIGSDPFEGRLRMRIRFWRVESDPHVSSIYMIAALNPVRLHFLYIAFLIPDLDLISSSFYVPFFSVHIQISSIILQSYGLGSFTR